MMSETGAYSEKKSILVIAVSMILCSVLAVLLSWVTVDWFVTLDSLEAGKIISGTIQPPEEMSDETVAAVHSDNSVLPPEGVSVHFRMNQIMYSLSQLSGYILSAGMGTCATF